MEVTIVALWYLVAVLTVLVVSVTASAIAKLFVTIAAHRMLKGSKSKLEAQIKAMRDEP